MDRLVTIELFGQPYTFRAESEMNQARTVADNLVKKVEGERNKHPDPSQSQSSRLAILISVALNIANENYELKTQHAETMEKLNLKAGDILNALNSCPQ